MTNVLFIDDEEDIHEYFEFIMEQLENVTLHPFTSQNDAADFLSKNNPDYLFIDWRMPEGSAEDFVLAHKDNLNFTKKYLVTGELELTDDQKYYFEDVIYKPFKSEQIKKVLAPEE